jgi:hypothetical protein
MLSQTKELELGISLHFAVYSGEELEHVVAGLRVLRYPTAKTISGNRST